MPKVIIQEVPKAANGSTVSPQKAREILHDGTIRGKKITDKQRKYFGYRSNQQAQSGLTVEDGAATPISPSTTMINGNTHQYGGTDIMYGGQKVEAESGEPVYKSQDGSLIIAGNMTVPGTNKKFKSVAKQLADKEAKVNKRMQEGTELINNSNPDDKWDLLKFNSGVANVKGGLAKSKELAQNREHLGKLQEAMLQMSDEMGVDPQAFSKGNLKAKNGLTIKAQAGKTIPTGEDPNNWYKDPKDGLYHRRLLSDVMHMQEQPQKVPQKLDLSRYTNKGNRADKTGVAPSRQSTYFQQPQSTQPNQQVTTQPVVNQPTQNYIPIQPNDNTNTSNNTSDLSVAQRHNNPGNMKYAAWMSKYGAVRGEPDNIDHDGSYYAKFPDMQTGLNALKQQLHRPLYLGKTVEEAISSWTGGHPYNTDLGGLKGKRVADLSENELNGLVNVITKGEDSKVYNQTQPYTSVPTTTDDELTKRIRGYKPLAPYQLTDEQLNQQPNTDQFNRINSKDYSFDFTNPPKLNKPTSARPFNPTQIMGEVYAGAANKQVPVWSQRYEPQLYQPYQVSFQDRLNENTATFNALRKNQTDNPSSLATMASQKYQADTGVLGEEFRTNQAISNDIVNKNVSLLNDAQYKNLSLADTQAVRQSQARSLTKGTNQAILNSVSNKVLQHELENKTLQAYENLTDYRINPETGSMNYYGPKGQDLINWGGIGYGNNMDEGTRVSRQFNGSGNPIKTTYTTQPPLRTLQMEMNVNKTKQQSLMQMINSGTRQGRKTFDFSYLNPVGYQPPIQ